MRILILALAIGLLSCNQSSSDNNNWYTSEYICKENSRGNCDCCHTLIDNSCAIGNTADRTFMPCVDAREFGYRIVK